ncbi:DISARM system SNF2-like helicase DrmD [Natrialbaceae archaeon A-CW2]
MATQHNSSHSPPERGQLVQVRNRPAIVTGVTSSNSQEQPLNLVTVDYLDGHEHPQTDQILWELEPVSGYLENAGWPAVPQYQPDPPDTYQAYLDSIRWTSLQSIQSILDDDEELPLVSPWASAVQIEDYQLTPLLKAMNMPSVNLLLADDVGLGKTIQAGLIATELILRRRINRILIVCPASLQVQWQEEMKDKFHLDFTILDSDEVRRTQRELGSDVNPWSVHNHIITSMDYLRQEVIYQDFEASARKRQQEMGGAFSPWDLLVVDEAHHFSPKSPTDDTLRTKMMRRLTQWFEHRLFLTATPHNGFTTSFLGLLELLDPVRFIQKPNLSDTDRRHLDTVMVRRLKRDINEASTVDRFAERDVHGVPVKLTEEEKQLFKALRKYKKEAKEELAKSGKQEVNWGKFIFTLLNKRLLSSPYAFARTWWRHVGSREFVSKDELQQTFDDVEEDIEDDLEREDRERLALSEGGSWLFQEAPELEGPAEQVSEALRELGWTEEITAEGPEAGLDIPDSKVEGLIQHLQYGFPGDDLQALLGTPDDLKDDERLILFTEYKDTQDHILARLEEAGFTGHTVQAVYGGMSRSERDDVKQAFNDPDSPMRILVGTDSASEGLNLQHMCRYVSHYEIPWNPMRLEQRNGRVDRHGQERDVHIFHYTSDDEADQQFLAYVLNKVNEARHDLGSVGTVIDQGVQKRFWGSGLEQEKLGDWVDTARENDPAREDLETVEPVKPDEFAEAKRRFQIASQEYELSPDNIRNVVENYLEIHNARLEDSNSGYLIQNARGQLKRFLIQNVADETEAMPRLVFDPDEYLNDINGREIYRPKKGTKLIRIGHPLVETSMSFFRRALWGQEDDVNRWTVVGYEPEMGNEAYVQFHYLVTARNQLQEVVDAEVGSWWFHVTSNGLSRIGGSPPIDDSTHTLTNETMQEWWNDLRPQFIDVESTIEPLEVDLRERVRDDLEDDLEAAGEEAREELEEEFQQRMNELEKDLGEQRRERLREQLQEAEEKAEQLTFDPELNIQRQQRVEELRRRLSEEDLAVWDENQKLMRERLERENERFLDEVLPKRYTLADEIDVVEIGARLYVPDKGGEGA